MALGFARTRAAKFAVLFRLGWFAGHGCVASPCEGRAALRPLFNPKIRDSVRLKPHALLMSMVSLVPALMVQGLGFEFLRQLVTAVYELLTLHLEYLAITGALLHEFRGWLPRTEPWSLAWEFEG